ncbi:MAG TPA: prenyltransferase/squalene oxidase repeat-containing protein [Oculatellaceae cyanobacterium]
MSHDSSANNQNADKSAFHEALATAMEKALQNLKDGEQNGWWPYVGQLGPSIEATSWCALALHAASPNKESSTKTTKFLLEKQNADGGWSTAPGCGKSDWSSSPAVLALRLLNEQEALTERPKVEKAILSGSNFIFDLRTDPFHSIARLLLFLSKGEEGLKYARGWPWNRDCSYWVEPTVYSLLALKLPAVPDRHIIRAAIRHASLYLHEHTCRDGGWNHGAALVLSVYAPPYTITTAEALLALQDEPHSLTIQKALELIQQNNKDADSSLTLAWTILALHAYQKPIAAKVAQLLAHQKEDGGFGTNNAVTAISTLALLAAARDYNLLKLR